MNYDYRCFFRQLACLTVEGIYFNGLSRSPKEMHFVISAQAHPCLDDVRVAFAVGCVLFFLRSASKNVAMKYGDALTNTKPPRQVSYDLGDDTLSVPANVTRNT
jgi:hypothetical protein